MDPPSSRALASSVSMPAIYADELNLSKEKLTTTGIDSMDLSRPSRMERNPYRSTAPDVRQHVGRGCRAEATPGAGSGDRYHYHRWADKGVVSATQQADGEGA